MVNSSQDSKSEFKKIQQILIDPLASELASCVKWIEIKQDSEIHSNLPCHLLHK